MDVAIGFGGAGDVDEKNIDALLNDLLDGYERAGNQEEINFILVFPDKIGRSEKGLKKVRKFIEDQFEEDDIIDVPLEEVCDVIMEEGNEWLLILIPSDHANPDQATESLLDAAIEKGIHVKDLTKALDDLSFDDEEDEVPEEEPEEKPKRPRGKPRSTESSEGLDEFKVETTSSPAEPKMQVEQSLKYIKETYSDEAQATITSEHGPELVKFTGKEETLSIEGLIRQIVREEVSTYLSQLGGLGQDLKSAEITTQGPLPGTITTNDTIEVVKGADGELRKKGRGRLRKGDEVITISRDEAEEKGIL